MRNKLRVDRETIDPRKTYRGDRVLELIEVSFNNGYSKGIREKQSSEYRRGYDDGFNEAGAELNALKAVLKNILGIGGAE